MTFRSHLKSIVISLLLVSTLALFGGLSAGNQTTVKASRTNAYDLSEWQGQISNHQAHRLKNEVNFVILRAQYGQNYQDRQLQNSINKMTKHHIPYGVYSYSLYHNNHQADNEATALYNRAPRANFYVNDIEQNNAGRRIDSATKAWARQMKSLTRRPVVLYSYANFIRQNLMPARRHYNAVWVASYSNRRPATGYRYDLWQYTSGHYSRALRKRIDASEITGDKPLSFWIGKGGSVAAVKPVSAFPQVKVTRHHQHRRFNLNHHELRKYHHEVRKISRTLKRGHRLSRNERKALRIYRFRHGHDFRI